MSLPEKRLRVWPLLLAFGLVSLVSVSARNWCYLCGTVERVAEGETVEIVNIDAVFVHAVEKMVG